MESYDVVIVGAGPAGLKCAEILAKNGKKVVVLEKNNILGDKICAGGLSLKALELGIPNSIIQRKFKNVKINTPHQTTEVKLDKFVGATVNRKDLGAWMGKKAKKEGADIILNSNVTKINDGSIVINNKNKINYTYLVGADGANSIVRKYLGLTTDKFIQAPQYIIPKKLKDAEIFFDPDKFGPLFLWVFPYKNSTSIGTGWLSLSKHHPVFDIKLPDMIKNLTDFCKERCDIKKAEFQSFMINYDYKGHEFGNKFLIGDAGGFACGLSGEGISFAIKSGEDVANKIINKKYSCPNIKHILKIKKIEEGMILKTFKINKLLARSGYEFFDLLLKIRWIDKEILEKMS